MRPLSLLALMLAACSPEPSRPFPAGVAGPMSPRLRAEALRLGYDAVDAPPAGAAIERAGDEDDHTLSADRLRFLAARAAYRGTAGVFFLPPRLPAGLDWADYPEEWQAASGVLRELHAMRPVLERGLPAPLPFPVAQGLFARAWSRGGRTYVLVLNPTSFPMPLDGAALAGRRALFRPRSDPRETLERCGRGVCLPPQGVLWLEGRLLSGDER